MNVDDFYTKSSVEYKIRIFGIFEDPNPELPILAMLHCPHCRGTVIYGRYLEYKSKGKMTCREVVSKLIKSVCEDLEIFKVITIPEILVFVHPLDMYYERIELIFKLLRYYKLDDVKIYPDNSKLFVTINSNRLKKIPECSFILGVLKQILTFKSNIIQYLIENPNKINSTLILLSCSGYPLYINHNLAKRHFRRGIPLYFNEDCDGWLSSLRNHKKVIICNKAKTINKLVKEIKAENGG